MLPAEVRCRFVMCSADGPVESAMISRPAGHWFDGPIESLTLHGADRFPSRCDSGRLPDAETRARSNGGSAHAEPYRNGITRQHYELARRDE